MSLNDIVHTNCFFIWPVSTQEVPATIWGAGTLQRYPLSSCVAPEEDPPITSLVVGKHGRRCRGGRYISGLAI